MIPKVNGGFLTGRWYRVKSNCRVEGEFSNREKGNKLPVSNDFLLACVVTNNTRATFFVYRRKSKTGGWRAWMSKRMIVKVTLNLDQAGFLEEVDPKE